MIFKCVIFYLNAYFHQIHPCKILKCASWTVWILKLFVKNKMLLKVESVIFSELCNKILKTIEGRECQSKKIKIYNKNDRNVKYLQKITYIYYLYFIFKDFELSIAVNPWELYFLDRKVFNGKHFSPPNKSLWCLLNVV